MDEADATQGTIESVTLQRDQAWKLIALVSDQFEHDIMSVQCFDLDVIVRPVVALAKIVRSKPDWFERGAS